MPIYSIVVSYLKLGIAISGIMELGVTILVSYYLFFIAHYVLGNCLY